MRRNLKSKGYKMTNPINIDSRLELMVDDHIIDNLTGDARLTMHRSTPQNVAIDLDKSWEGNSCAYMTVFKDGEIYRMYYRGSHAVYTKDSIDETHPEYTCYAESYDGINYTKPGLGLFEIAGTLDNNVIMTPETAGRATHNFCPFIDTRPDVPDSEKYKAVGGLSDGLFAFMSDNAIHWKRLKEEPIITQGAFDSQNLAFWDSERNEYRAYFRDFRDGRDIKTCTSRDFLNWTDPVYLEYSPGRVSQLYTNQINPYYRAPHILLGFPTRYIDHGWTEATKALPQLEYRQIRASRSVREGTALTDGMFIVGRERHNFKVWPESFIRPGLKLKENWFYGDNYQSLGLLETKSNIHNAPDELSFYTSESSMQGNSTRWRRHTIRIDGFASLNAPLSCGEMLTKPLIFKGDRLIINYSTSAAGSLQVEIQDAKGYPISGFSLSESEEMFGDSLSQAFIWKNGSDVSSLAGKTVRLRFVLRDADLYSIKFM
ncbi:hypothetical protein GF312_05000 [Candidatus Poribacteria bacterium]|nr:hypothetical protein [Candidatus Poribacteria bacterium]